MKYIPIEKLIAEIERLHNEYLLKDNCSYGVSDICEKIEEFIVSLQQEQPEVDLEEEITDKSRACCNCINGVTQYPNCFCWQHEYCNTDEPYKIPKEDWVDTAKTCKKFEHELWYSERKEE